MPKKKKQKVDLGSVILLENMVGKGEVDSELERETAEECKKFGNVMQSRIVERSDDVRIFIKFDSEVTAKRAIDALNGRLFGGRRIRATSYDAESFAKEDLDL
jgi:copper chaperone CopZ